MVTKRTHLLAACPLGLALALTLFSCSGRHNSVENEEPSANNAPLASTLRMGDAAVAGQLLNGFYGIENNTWRWTSKRFSVLLGTPPGAGQNGATLSFAFTVADAVFQKTGPVTLTASINGTTLKSQAYNTSGSYTLSADVPASLLTTDSVKIDFALDKSIRPDQDKRELGVIANSASLASK